MREMSIEGHRFARWASRLPELMEKEQNVLKRSKYREAAGARRSQQPHANGPSLCSGAHSPQLRPDRQRLCSV